MWTERIKEFHVGVGALIMACQCIERDVKVIYAGMLKGDLYENYRSVERLSLGQTLALLQALDNSDERPYFSAEEYRLLDRIRHIRNHWAHEAYARFVYKDGEEQTRAFEKEWNRLRREGEQLGSLQRQTEKARFAVLKKYNRI